MPATDTCFTPFVANIENIALPEKFTFPFYYTPHPLCVIAAQELQNKLSTQTEWLHDFGINGISEHAIGKMFGVLIVQNQFGQLGYLAAYSGKVADSNHLSGFVPPVFDMLREDGFFLQGQEKINQLTSELQVLENSPELEMAKQFLADVEQEAALKLEQQKALMIEGRKRRKAQRAEAAQNNPDGVDQQLLDSLSRESVAEKLRLRDLKLDNEQQLAAATQELHKFFQPVSELKAKRKAMSNRLQKQLFANYRFLNRYGVEKDLADIFKETAFHIPPAGAGECAAPKLIQYAFKNNLKPVAMAEFWWGCSPKSEIRQHKQFYGSCTGKCEPILSHMLEGIPIDDNPLLENPAEGKSLDIVYEDEHMVVVNKPADFLSVPGKNIEDSVYTRIRQMYPRATGTLVVHRLDMATSGLMVLALTARAQKQLQKQFISKTAYKRYVALVEGDIKEDSGVIKLPMRGDVNDRPRQLVCYQHGKPAETRWEVVERKAGHTRLDLYPKTGRTHQLRVHCAHAEGLNAPILGDDLYGRRSDRLFLHAESLTLEHPISKKEICFDAMADF